jgi:hypothetical protein
MVLRTLTILLATALALPAAATAAPRASFFYTPQFPQEGDTVRFNSTSCDPAGGSIQQAWDLDGDGAYDDATGATASARFFTQSVFSVGLQVTGAEGAVSTRRKTLAIDSIYALPQPDTQRRLSATVRLVGEAFRRRSRIRLLTVTEAPACARVRATCRGRGCKRRRVVRFKDRGLLRIRAWDKRTLAAGAVLEIRVTRRNLIGKLTRFRIRRGMAPRRTDLCLMPGETTGSRCPPQD